MNIDLDIHHVEKVGPGLYSTGLLRGELRSITVPATMVSTLALAAVNRKRDAELVQELSYKAKNMYAKSRMPRQLIPLAVATSVAIALVANLEDEVDLLHTVSRKFGWMFQVHTTAVALGELAYRTWLPILLVFVATVTGLSLAEVFDEDTTQRLWIAGAGGGGVLIALATLLCCTGMVRVVREWRAAYWRAALTDPDTPSAPLLGHGTPVPGPLPPTRYVRDPIPDHELSGRVELKESQRKPLVERPALLPSGIIVDGLVPVVPASDQASELSAVTNRVLSPKDNAEPKAIDDFRRALDQPIFRDLAVKVDSSMNAVHRWIKGLRGRFTAVYISNMEETAKELYGEAATSVKTKSFLKVEKSAPLDVEGGKAVKPRLIQPPPDIDKVMLGPVVSQMLRRSVSMFDGVKTSVVYGAVHTSDYIGARVDAFVDSVGGEEEVVGCNVDMAGYDSTLSLDLQEPLIEEVYGKIFGLPAWLITWFYRVKPSGTTPHGVSYTPLRSYGPYTMLSEAKRLAKRYERHGLKATVKEQGLDGSKVYFVEVEDFQMTSGRPDTNLTDTLVLVATFVALLKVPYLLLVCGDDGFLLLRKQDAEVFNEIMDFQRKLGLKPEGKVCQGRWEWEFCSRLFFYGIRSDGRSQTVLGPKPFRHMARMGWNTTLPGSMNAAAAALSVCVDAAHVPFLRVFAQRTKELCTKAKLKPSGRRDFEDGMRASSPFGVDPRNYVLTEARYSLGYENELALSVLLSKLRTVPTTLQWLPALEGHRVDSE